MIALEQFALPYYDIVFDFAHQDISANVGVVGDGTAVLSDIILSC